MASTRLPHDDATGKEMHTEYFGLRSRPFQILPDSRFLFVSEQHGRAIANIKFALANKDCFVVITGEIGVGKTTILNDVLKTLDSNIEMVHLTHTSLTPMELLQAVLLAFDQPVKHDSKVLLFADIRKFLLEKYAEGKHVLIAVDEAQNLGSAALEELRLLTCIEAGTKELLTVVLMGQPNLSDLINSEALHNLRQRTRLRQHLRRLTAEETVEYLRHRLSVSGGEYDEIFDQSTVDLIYKATSGTPRLINTLCDTAMTATAIRDGKRVTEKCVQEVLEELGWDTRRISKFEANANDSEPAPSLLLFHEERRGELIAKVRCESPITLIGRCESNHLRINDKSISRRHALIAFEKGKFRIEDLGSTNGTFHNSSRCGTRTYILKSGDTLSLGCYTVIFRDADGTANFDSPNTPNESSDLPDLSSTEFG